MLGCLKIWLYCKCIREPKVYWVFQPRDFNVGKWLNRCWRTEKSKNEYYGNYCKKLLSSLGLEKQKVIWGYQRTQMFGAVALMSGDFNLSKGHCLASVGSLRVMRLTVKVWPFWESGKSLGSASPAIASEDLCWRNASNSIKIHRKNSIPSSCLPISFNAPYWHNLT